MLARARAALEAGDHGEAMHMLHAGEKMAQATFSLLSKKAQPAAQVGQYSIVTPVRGASKK